MGAGGHASVLLDLIKLRELNIVGVCDPFLAKENIEEWKGLPVLGDDEYLNDLDPNNYLIINGIGSIPGTNRRFELQKFITKNGFNCPTLVHPLLQFLIEPEVSEKGVQIMPGSIIQSGSKIMNNVVLNTNTSIDHDCIIHDGVNISPGVVVCGDVEIEENVFIGCGARIINNIKIGKNSIIGAGSLILNDVSEGSKVIQNMQNDNIWEKALLSLDATVEDGIKSLEESGLQICLVVDKNKKLLGSVTDGDIRRSLLAQKSLQNKIDTIMTKKPLVIHQGLESDQIKLLMNANKINQLPEIDKKGAVIGLHTWENIIKPVKRPNTFVIMAGGFGTRMEEITESCPKPMVKLGGKPMLEHIIDRAKIEGFTNFIISVFYLKDQIKEYFGDGKKWDVHINYIEETEPLGTAGALSLIEINLQYPFIVTNGDANN